MKVRITIDLHPADYEDLEKIQRRFRDATKAETIRALIRFASGRVPMMTLEEVLDLPAFKEERRSAKKKR